MSTLAQVAVQIQYQRRRSWRLSVTSAGKVKVSAPEGMPPSQIDALLDKNRRWISRRLTEHEALKSVPRLKLFKTGEKFLFLGDKVELAVESSSSGKTVFSDGRLLLSLRLPSSPVRRKELIRKKIKIWFKENAREILGTRMKRWADDIKVQPVKMTIKEMRSRWGSCSSRGNINYNWRILMAPMHIVDYLIVHELCHLLHPNHSQAFWTEVERHLPDWKARRNWLRHHSSALEIP